MHAYALVDLQGACLCISWPAGCMHAFSWPVFDYTSICANAGEFRSLRNSVRSFSFPGRERQSQSSVEVTEISAHRQ